MSQNATKMDSFFTQIEDICLLATLTRTTPGLGAETPVVFLETRTETQQDPWAGFSGLSE